MKIDISKLKTFIGRLFDGSREAISGPDGDIILYVNEDNDVVDESDGTVDFAEAIIIAVDAIGDVSGLDENEPFIPEEWLGYEDSPLPPEKETDYVSKGFFY